WGVEGRVRREVGSRSARAHPRHENFILTCLPY
ncbi:hypothetical protein A2U01_0116035, partial [Trifolium medium]|nr:hypothetical protein [Trifolium medium]